MFDTDAVRVNYLVPRRPPGIWALPLAAQQPRGSIRSSNDSLTTHFLRRSPPPPEGNRAFHLC